MRWQRALTGTIGALLFVFLGLQLVRPELKNPPVTAELQAPPEVKQILKNSCYNCHSNQTKLVWFDKLVPAYWLVASDVRRARMHLNFSELGAQPSAKQKGVLFEAVNQIQMGAMPLPSYRLAHPDANVTAEQLAVLRAYLNPPSQAAVGKEADVAHPAVALSLVQPELNGIRFLPEYKTWKAISSTDRFDNHTLRVILGNDVAIKAIAGNHINPWPDGAAFAKVAWLPQPDGKGLLRTGAFQQVEFMIKDSGKYAATKGWGWARWRGADLKPYGTSPGFVNECISCHLPLRKNDYVFTMPIVGRHQG